MPWLRRCVRRTDARCHQQLRRIEGAATQDDFAPGPQRLLDACAHDADAARPFVLDHKAQYLRVREHVKVRAAAVQVRIFRIAAVQIGTRGIPAFAIELRDLIKAGAFLLLAVEVRVQRQAGLPRGFTKRWENGLGVRRSLTCNGPSPPCHGSSVRPAWR